MSISLAKNIQRSLGNKNLFVDYLSKERIPSRELDVNWPAGQKEVISHRSDPTYIPLIQ